ncbi:melanocyte protein PMEL [Spea bombifrons]|uniref:melanocyte protein PMEL n=1 Tax=Spea bombifrons TaxID=233779 RepID=UPI00234B224B|nr:melanocyte protein PMEL [Spea bombifrons]
MDNTEFRMHGLLLLAVLWVLCAGIEAQSSSPNRVQQSNQRVRTSKRPPFRSWNSQMYPIWRGGDTQQRDCWKGGQVTFDLINDAPTLTGAKATFFIKLNFPHNQTVLPDGQVVWNQNRTENGTWTPSGEPVYPDEGTERSDCTFPDGSPFPHGAGKRRSKFVYVWQTWGKYWQVVDGPSSNLTVDTDGIPLGSYNMEVVVYHYRGHQKFIPIGSISSQFTITDQIPVSVSVSQLLDLDQEDQRFIQNRAVSFSVAIHDPSHYLQAADISFSWDFGDESGTLITRNTGVTHTYVSAGVFKPTVVLQAAIPVLPCGSTAAATELSVTTNIPSEPTTGAEATTSTGEVTVSTGTAAPASSNTTLPEEAVAEQATVAPMANELNVEDAQTLAVTLPAVVPSTGQTVASDVVPAEQAVPTEGVTVASNGETEADDSTVPEGEAVTLAVVSTEGETTVNDVAVTVAAVTVPEAVPSEAVAVDIQEMAAVISSADNTEETASSGTPEGVSPTVPSTEETSNVQMATTEQGAMIVVAKRQAPEGPLVGCTLYRYGTFATELDIVQGIESMQIVQVEPILAADVENAVDLTITCQGSVPSQVCTVISDSSCETPQETVCNPVAPLSDCQMVVRQVFNSTGVFCVNVSLTDDVSLAVASAQVTVSGGGRSSTNGVVITVGVLLVAFAVAAVAYTYRRTKSYVPLRTEHTSVNWFPNRTSLRLFFNSFVGRSMNGESSPLLNGRVV